jgi:hypothetical protein
MYEQYPAAFAFLRVLQRRWDRGLVAIKALLGLPSALVCHAGSLAL